MRLSINVCLVLCKAENFKIEIDKATAKILWIYVWPFFSRAIVGVAGGATRTAIVKHQVWFLHRSFCIPYLNSTVRRGVTIWPMCPPRTEARRRSSTWAHCLSVSLCCRCWTTSSCWFGYCIFCALLSISSRTTVPFDLSDWTRWTSRDWSYAFGLILVFFNIWRLYAVIRLVIIFQIKIFNKFDG